MINLHEIRYVRLGTRNLDAATEYATRILGLQQVRREDKSVYFRSDSRDHTLVYTEGDPKQHSTAFEVTSRRGNGRGRGRARGDEGAGPPRHRTPSASSATSSR